jgi:hypothetical protein
MDADRILKLSTNLLILYTYKRICLLANGTMKTLRRDSGRGCTYVCVYIYIIIYLHRCKYVLLWGLASSSAGDRDTVLIVKLETTFHLR